jgi:hypothetical protein
MAKSSVSNGITKRKIQFAKVNCGLDDSQKEIIFEIDKVFKNFPKENNRYQSIDAAVSLCSAIDKISSPQHFCFWNRRNSGLPQVEKLGKFKDVPLQDEEGLAEKTHVIFFPNNIIGYEYNHHGPRISRLDSYFHHISPGRVPRFSVQTLVHPDVMKRFDDAGDLFNFDIRVSRQYAEILKNDGDSLGKILFSTAQLGEFDSLSITGSVDKRKGHIINGGFKRILKAIMSKADSGLDALKIKGENSQWLDVLKDQICFEVDVTLEQTAKSRSVNSTIMYKKINEAYSSSKEILEEARLIE